MKCNIGKIDKTLRIVLGLALIAYGVYVGNYIIAAVGLVPLLTAFISICPLYSMLAINTGCNTQIKE